MPIEHYLRFLLYSCYWCWQHDEPLQADLYGEMMSYGFQPERILEGFDEGVHPLDYRFTFGPKPQFRNRLEKYDNGEQG